MLESFYTDSKVHVSTTFEHITSVVVYFSLGFILLYLGKYKWNDDQRRKYVIYLCVFIYFLQWFKTGIRLYLGNFDHTVDIPLHVCNILPLGMALAYYYRSRITFAIFFFWVMCGTLQANVTPTLWDFFPHYESLRYWFTHSLLPFIAVYGLVVLGFKIFYKDVLLSWACMTIGAYLMYHVNNALGSNYWFTNRKPGAATIYDALGPWPTYMFQLVPLAMVLFSIMFFLTRGVRWVSVKFYGSPNYL